MERVRTERVSSHLLMVFLGLFAFRAFNALSVQTFFDPDETWQALEVAHEWVFQYPFFKFNFLPY